MLTEKQIKKRAYEFFSEENGYGEVVRTAYCAGADDANAFSFSDIEAKEAEIAELKDKIADLEDKIYNLKIKFETLNERDSE